MTSKPSRLPPSRLQSCCDSFWSVTYAQRFALLIAGCALLGRIAYGVVQIVHGNESPLTKFDSRLTSESRQPNIILCPSFPSYGQSFLQFNYTTSPDMNLIQPGATRPIRPLTSSKRPVNISWSALVGGPADVVLECMELRPDVSFTSRLQNLGFIVRTQLNHTARKILRQSLTNNQALTVYMSVFEDENLTPGEALKSNYQSINLHGLTTVHFGRQHTVRLNGDVEQILVTTTQSTTYDLLGNLRVINQTTGELGWRDQVEDIGMQLDFKPTMNLSTTTEFVGFTFIDLISAVGGVFSIVWAAALWFVGKGTYKPTGFVHSCFPSPEQTVVPNFELLTLHATPQSVNQ